MALKIVDLNVSTEAQVFSDILTACKSNLSVIALLVTALRCRQASTISTVSRQNAIAQAYNMCSTACLKVALSTAAGVGATGETSTALGGHGSLTVSTFSGVGPSSGKVGGDSGSSGSHEDESDYITLAYTR